MGKVRRLAVTALLLSASIGGAQVRDNPMFGPDSGARQVMALAEAYPDRIERVQYRGDWQLFMDGAWYTWAEGRLLPVALAERRDEFVSIRFYSYTLGPFDVPPVPAELAERLRQRTRQRGSDQRLRFNGFLDALYGVASRADAEELMERVTFLGRETRVHPLLVAPLESVERRIRRAAREDVVTRRYVENLSDVHGYNWRNIAGTNRRSYHAYGVAVDLVPLRYDGWAYWQWAADGGVEDWWELDSSDRKRVPQPVIDAFEAEGFVWGGKWLFFDNIHFEYRPEVIALARARSAQ